MFKKCKKLFTTLVSASLCVAMVCLSGCAKEEKDLVKALNTMKIDSSTAWKATMNVEVASGQSFGTDSYSSEQKMNFTAYTTLNQDDVLKNLKTDITFNATSTEKENGSTRNQSTDGSVYMREAHNILDMYAGITHRTP